MPLFRNALLSVFYFITLLISNSSVSGQSIDKNSSLYRYNQKSAGYLEGYSKTISGNDFAYHSLRDDLRDALLIRCRDGMNKASWVTQIIPADYKGEYISFGIIAAINCVDRPDLKLVFKINGISRFEVPITKRYEWEISGADGSSISFDPCEIDMYGDPHGYLTLKLPVKWVDLGIPVKIEVEASVAGEQTWLIIYKAPDAIAALRQMMKLKAEFTIALNKLNGELSVTGPKSFEGKTILVKAKNFEKGFSLENAAGGTAGRIILTRECINNGFTLVESGAELLNVDQGNMQTDVQRISGNSVVRIESRWQGDLAEFKVRRQYAPKTAKAINEMISSGRQNGSIYLMNSSHQDIAWMDTPDKCVIERDTMLLTPLINKAVRNSDYRFDVEDALMLREYITRHPDRKNDIAQLLKSGQISCGSSFIQPYEEMYSGEALIRQFYFGARWLKKTFGYSADTYWNVDVPGRTLQMPQIASKAGTKYLIMSRHEEGIYNWFSPDGSYITAYSPGHYADAQIYLTKDFFAAVPSISANYGKWAANFDEGKKPVVPLLSDWDMSPAKDYSELIARWKNITSIENENGENHSIALPEIKISLASEFMKKYTESAKQIPAIKGERPQVWLYIQSPSHFEALKSSRRGDIVLTAAEKFSAINSLLERSFTDYPEKELNNSWEAKIYPDHGWGGKGGDITDSTFKAKYDFALTEGERILNKAVASIAVKIKTEEKKGIPVILFNSMGVGRNAPVKVKLTFNRKNVKDLSVTDAKGRTVPSQSNGETYDKEGNLKEAYICFTAENVPSLGYKTYYVETHKETLPKPVWMSGLYHSNNFYRVEFTDKGISRIYDKVLGKDLIDDSKFSCGEVFMMKSVGEDAGEFSDIQMPVMDDFETTRNYKLKWERTADGPDFTSFKFRQKVKYAVIEEEVIIYNRVKKIDFNISILNWEGVMFREFRAAFPVNMKKSSVSYEVPFGVVNVGRDEIAGAAGERYKTICADIHPRGIENWIAAMDNEAAIILSSTCGVADYIDPTTPSINQTILQPILLASRRSCNGEGNEYPQKGNHYYNFSLTSKPVEKEMDYSFGREANEELFAVVSPKRIKNANLPEELSFFSTGTENLSISTIKKAEDENGLIVRIYENEGLDTKLKMKSYFNFSSYINTNIIEYPLDMNAAKNGIEFKKSYPIEIGKFAIETFLFKL